MKTLLLLIIGTLFGIWFYSNHSNLIPKGVTQNIDEAVDWTKDLWPKSDREPYVSSEPRRRTTNNQPSAIETQEIAADKNLAPATSGSRQTEQATPPNPREEAISTYSRVIRMIDSAQ